MKKKVFDEIKLGNYKLAVFGCGACGKEIIEEILKTGNQLKILMDNKLSGSYYKKFLIENPINIKNIEVDYIIIATNNLHFYYEIFLELISYGINPDKIVTTCSIIDTIEKSYGIAGYVGNIKKIYQQSKDKNVIVLGTDCEKNIYKMLFDRNQYSKTDGSNSYVVANSREGDCKWDQFICLLDINELLFEEGGEKIAIITDCESVYEYYAFCMIYGGGIFTKVISYVEIVQSYLFGAELMMNPEEQKMAAIVNCKENYSIIFGNPMIKSIEYNNVDIWKNSFLPSEIIRNISKCVKKNTICKKPFEYVEIVTDNKYCYVQLCCAEYLKIPFLGRFDLFPFDKIWNSNLAKAVRVAINMGCYFLCDRNCPTYFDEICAGNGEIKKKDIDKKPTTVSINIDYSCNLYCAFCREKRRSADPKQKEYLKQVALKIRNEVLPECSTIRLSGNGEVFFSDVYREILYDESNKGKNLYIVTNATLLTAKNFEPLEKIYESISVHVSLGTMNKNVYEQYWRGSSWKTVLNNLNYIGHLRKENRIMHLKFYYLLTTDTYYDLERFYYFAKELGADEIAMTRLFPWGEFIGKKYDAKSLFECDGTLKEAYRSFFNNKIFFDPIWKGNVIERINNEK